MPQEVFKARPLNAAEYHALLKDSNRVLRISDGTREGTYRFWTEDGWLFWRCLTWTQEKRASTTDLMAILDTDDVTTQLLTTAGVDRE